MSMPTSFAYNPFQKRTKTVHYAPQGDMDTWTAYDREEEYTDISDALREADPWLAENWSNPSNMELLDGDAENGYRVKIKTGDKQGTIYHLTPDGQGGYKVAAAGQTEWNTNENLFDDKLALAMMAAVGGIGAAAYGAGAVAAGGGGFGAAEGTVAAANLTSDPLGALLAQNAGNWGLNIAPEFAASIGGELLSNMPLTEAPPGLTGSEFGGPPAGGEGIFETTFTPDYSNLRLTATDVANAGLPEVTPEMLTAANATSDPLGYLMAQANAASPGSWGTLAADALTGITTAGGPVSWFDTIVGVGKSVWDGISNLTPGQAGLIGGAAKLLGGLYMDDQSREAYTDYLNRVDQWRKEDKATAEANREDEQAFRTSEREAAEAFQRQLIEEQRAYQQKKEDEDRARRNANWNARPPGGW